MYPYQAYLKQAAAADGKGDVQPKQVQAAADDDGSDRLGHRHAVILQRVQCRDYAKVGREIMGECEQGAALRHSGLRVAGGFMGNTL